MSLVLLPGEQLQVVMDAAHTTAESIARASGAVQLGNLISAAELTQGTTPVALLAGALPAASYPGTAISGLSFINLDSVQHTVTFQTLLPASGSTAVPVFKAQIPAGFSVYYESNGSWRVLNAQGDVMTTSGVTSVGLSMPSEFSVSDSPVTSSGTLTVAKANQSANQVWAGPTSGVAAAPGFRSLVLADLPAGINTAPPINAQTGTSYTVLAADIPASSHYAGIITMSNAAANTLTVPTGLQAGAQLVVVNLGVGITTVDVALVGGGTTVSLTTDQSVFLIQVAANLWQSV